MVESADPLGNDTEQQPFLICPGLEPPFGKLGAQVLVRDSASARGAGIGYDDDTSDDFNPPTGVGLLF
jgi:hypothetical protein